MQEATGQENILTFSNMKSANSISCFEAAPAKGGWILITRPRPNYPNLESLKMNYKSCSSVESVEPCDTSSTLSYWGRRRREFGLSNKLLPFQLYDRDPDYVLLSIRFSFTGRQEDFNTIQNTLLKKCVFFLLTGCRLNP